MDCAHLAAPGSTGDVVGAVRCGRVHSCASNVPGRETRAVVSQELAVDGRIKPVTETVPATVTDAVTDPAPAIEFLSAYDQGFARVAAVTWPPSPSCA